MQYSSTASDPSALPKRLLCSASVLLELLAAGHLLFSGNGWTWHSVLCSGSEGGGWSKVGVDDLKGLLQL